MSLQIIYYINILSLPLSIAFLYLILRVLNKRNCTAPFLNFDVLFVLGPMIFFQGECVFLFNTSNCFACKWKPQISFHAVLFSVQCAAWPKGECYDGQSVGLSKLCWAQVRYLLFVGLVSSSRNGDGAFMCVAFESVLIGHDCSGSERPTRE